MPVAAIIAICTAIAFAGGLAKEFYDHAGAFQMHMLASAFTCAFAGLMVALVATYYLPGMTLLVIALSGLSGWTGPIVLNYMTTIAATAMGSAMSKKLPTIDANILTPPTITPTQSDQGEASDAGKG